MPEKCYSPFFLNKFYLFTLGSSVLHGHFSSCGEWGPILVAVPRLPTVAASLAPPEHGSSGTWALVAVVPRLQSTDAATVAHGLNCSVAHGIPQIRDQTNISYTSKPVPYHRATEEAQGNVILLILLLPHNSFVSDFILILLYGSF